MFVFKKISNTIIVNFLFSVICFAAPEGGGWGDGHRVGNGGDAVYCSKAGENQLNGIYVLDEILANKLSLVSVTDSDVFMKSLIEKLKSVNYIGYELEAFYNSFLNKDDYSPEAYNLSWIPNDGELKNIPDSNMQYRTLSKNCLNIKQAVIRVADINKSPWEIEYTYNVNAISDLISKNKIDWLLVHEFLWNYMPDASKIRKVNEFFHNKKFMQFTENEINTFLAKFAFPELSYLSKGIIKLNSNFKLVNNTLFSEYNLLSDKNEILLVNLFSGKFFDSDKINKYWILKAKVSDKNDVTDVFVLSTNSNKLLLMSNGTVTEIDTTIIDVSNIETISASGSSGLLIKFKDGSFRQLFNNEISKNLILPITYNLHESGSAFEIQIIKNTENKYGVIKTSKESNKSSIFLNTEFDSFTKEEIRFKSGRVAYDLMFTNLKERFYLRIENGIVYRNKLDQDLKIVDSQLFPVIVVEKNNLQSIVNVQNSKFYFDFIDSKIESKEFYFVMNNLKGQKGFFIPEAFNNINCVISPDENADVLKENGIWTAKTQTEKSLTSQTFNRICKKL